MVYEHVNSKGKKYFLHQSGRLYYFGGTLNKAKSIDLPSGFIVVENPKTGLPMLKGK
ncbi:MAG: hypothetical protein V1676_06200 [Candidatus Diapherotrites archaeon]